MSNQEDTGRLVDAMGGVERIETKILDHGFIALVDMMPRLIPEGKTADFAIAQAARTSYGRGTRQVSEDESLIRYLMRHKHSTPFEFCELKFHVRMPIFVARQWIRHRTASVNEYSARYSVMSDDFYTPHAEDVCLQSMENKQGRDGSAESSIAQKFVDDSSRVHGDAYASYLSAIEGGVARETARCILPVSAYTEWYWKCDLHNIFHFLKLRMDSHAQKEIRVYAEAMYATIKPLFPLACSAFEDYRLNAMELTAAEVEAITSGHAPRIKNKREIQEWSEKAKKLGL